MKIGVVGGGVVGNATAQAFLNYVEEIRIHDTLPERSTHPLPDVLACEIIFVCLPTPQQEKSLRCDLSFIDGFFGSLSDQQKAANFVLRSTVPVGTTRRLSKQYGLPNLIHSPEFLTARTAVEDAKNPARNIIGVTGHWEDEPAQTLASLYRLAFGKTPLFVLTTEESELCKLVQNAFSAVKISFFNEIRVYADKVGADWDMLREALLAGGWINPMHTQVPGPDGKYGYGGACLPKDLSNLIACLMEANCTALVLGAAHTRNRSDRERTT